MKKILLFLFLSVLSITGFSQCTALSCTVTLTTQAQVDDFITVHPWENLNGNISVEGTVTNLNGLSHIKTISGGLFIQFASITSLSGLSNLTSVGEDLALYHLDIQNLSGLENLQSFKSLYIGFNELLTDISALDGLTITEAYDMTFDSNLILEDFTGIEKITKISNTLLISFSALTNLDQFNHLTSVFNFGLDGNTQLSDISGLANIPVFDAILLRNNEMLSMCAITPICSLLKPNGGYTISGNLTGCNSEDEIRSVCNALPVTLIGFSGRKEGMISELNWRTASETNSKNFEVEHSIDVKNWLSIGSLNSAIESKTTHNYTFTHNNPVAGANYYRLKMIDQDNTFSYSKIVNLFFEDDFKIVIHPNPVTDVLQIKSDQMYSIALVELIDIQGAVVYTSGQMTKRIPAHNLKDGMHVLRITKKDGSVSKHKMLVKK